MIWYEVAWVVLDMDCVFAWSSNYTVPYPAQVHAHMITYPYLLGGETYIYIYIQIPISIFFASFSKYVLKCFTLLLTDTHTLKFTENSHVSR